jgi:hypothetical protein
MKTYSRDRDYWKSVLGILEILIMVILVIFILKKNYFEKLFLLICLFWGMVCALIASTGWAQQADWVSTICQNYKTNQYVAALVECSQSSTSPNSYNSLSANTVKIATIAIFVLSLVIVLIIFLVHIFAALRKTKHWKIITRIVCIIILDFFNILEVRY